MAHRKQVQQPRICLACGTTFVTARKGHVHCSSACNTRAWRARKEAAQPSLPLAGSPAPLAPVPPAEVAPTTLAFSGQNIGTIAVGTAAGNLLSDLIKTVFTPKAKPAPVALYPTWPPAELLAAAQPPVWVADPASPRGQFLSPVAYQGHTLYLYVETGLTRVLWQAPTGEWHVVSTPADLAYLAANQPLSPGMRALIAQHVPGYDYELRQAYVLPSARG